MSSFKNALLKNKAKFFVHYSKLNALICEYFYKNHFFSDVFYFYTNTSRCICSYILVCIESFEGNLVLNNVIPFYRPSRPIYLRVEQLKRKLFFEKSLFLLSTSEGILNSVEAIHLGVGGLILFEYY